MNDCAETNNSNLTLQEKELLDYIKQNGYITELKIQELLKIKKTRAFNLLKQMKEKI